MPIPRASQLQPGTAVTIILKADQRSGKPTTGHIADILTKGDHPRGIKVRLTDGQIGRVQSLSSSSQTQALGFQSSDSKTSPSSSSANASVGSRRGMSRDVRTDVYDPEAREQANCSLFDYVRPAKQRRAGKKAVAADEEDEATRQARLEAEFPSLDTALIAAILADCSSIEDARGVLRGLR